MVPDIILGVLIYLIDTVIERRKERNRETLWEILKHVSWDFAGGPVVDCAPKAGGPGLMPGQGARSCTPQ